MKKLSALAFLFVLVISTSQASEFNVKITGGKQTVDQAYIFYRLLATNTAGKSIPATLYIPRNDLIKNEIEVRYSIDMTAATSKKIVSFAISAEVALKLDYCLKNNLVSLTDPIELKLDADLIPSPLAVVTKLPQKCNDFDILSRGSKGKKDQRI